jgi:DNA gyrase inhibitor GyrI
MSEMNVRIVKLEPVRVACASGFGAGPETQAWDKLKAWMRRKGLMDDLKSRRFFGFNNPNPSLGSPNYGYDQWVTVGAETVEDAEDRAAGVRILDFPGGLYAVSRVQFSGDLGAEFPQAWRRLVLWRESSRYRPASHQWLEEAIVGADGQLALNEFALHLPIAE